MILYNVTVSIDKAVHLKWLDWMRTTHIPDVMKTGCFRECRISRVHGEEEGGMTFAISYVAPTQEAFDNYQENHATDLQEEHTTKFNGKFAAFRTMLTIIEEFSA
ncbi:MAG TPA: DUF4286 family protein [Crocinitomicaceae bacterium]|nr:DUF4286 family protein [Crocinitomicaceae bacterium]